MIARCVKISSGQPPLNHSVISCYVRHLYEIQFKNEKRRYTESKKARQLLNWQERQQRLCFKEIYDHDLKNLEQKNKIEGKDSEISIITY